MNAAAHSCGARKLYPRRNLKIIKLTPIALGICESCNMRFQSHQPIEDDAEMEMRVAFGSHTCQHQDASPVGE
jgi:hypothetical protein